MEDIVKRFITKTLSPRREVFIAKLLTLFWGSVCVIFAFNVSEISQTVIESVNKIGSLINGPLLAVFLMGVLSLRINSRGAVSGFVTGFVVNLLLWMFVPEISWLWWNVIGFLIAYFTGYLVSTVRSAPAPTGAKDTYFRRYQRAAQTSGMSWRSHYIMLTLYGMAIFLFLLIISN
jgi:SSS family solute:Na+ symporter